MKRVLAVGLVLVLSVLASTWCAAEVKHPSELRYPELRLETPEYEEITFENGMRGFFIEDHEIAVVNIHMRVGTGRPPKEKTGLNRLGADGSLPVAMDGLMGVRGVRWPLLGGCR